MKPSAQRGVRFHFALAVLVAGLAFAIPGKARAEDGCSSGACTFWSISGGSSAGTCGVAPSGGKGCWCNKNEGEGGQEQAACETTFIE
jgi:hypothetical protein